MTSVMPTMVSCNNNRVFLTNLIYHFFHIIKCFIYIIKISFTHPTRIMTTFFICFHHI